MLNTLWRSLKACFKGQNMVTQAIEEGQKKHGGFRPLLSQNQIKESAGEERGNCRRWQMRSQAPERNCKNMETTIMCIFMSSKRETTDCETTLKHFVMVIQTHSPAQGKNKHPITTSKEPLNSHLLTPSTLHQFCSITCRGFHREPIPSPTEGPSSDNSGWTNTPFRTLLWSGQTACQLERKRILKIKISLHFPRGSPHNEKA